MPGLKSRQSARPRAPRAWRQFLAAQASGIVACDFLRAGTVPLRRVYAFSVREIQARTVHIPGATAHPAGSRTARQARDLRMDPGERAERFTSGCDCCTTRRVARDGSWARCTHAGSYGAGWTLLWPCSLERRQQHARRRTWVSHTPPPGPGARWRVYPQGSGEGSCHAGKR